MNNSIDMEKVRQIQALNATNKAANAFFEQASQRQRDKSETTIRRAADLCHVEYWQMREVFQKLAEIGVGTYITGRRGGESRLKWLYSLSSIGKAAKGEFQTLVSLQEHDPEEDADQELDDPSVEASLAGSVQMMEHSYKLRPKQTIQLTLPTDFNGREAERVAAWIRTLPFE